MALTLTPDFRLIPAIAEAAFSSLMRFASRLVSPSRKAEERVFGELVGKYDNMIKRICFGYARSSAEFEDLHQDALVNIWQGISKFRGDADIKTWVYRVTLNTCVSSLRLRNKKVEEVSLYDVVDFRDDSTEASEQIKELHESIARLGAVDKAVVMLWLEEYSYDEIAEMVGIKRNAVAVRLHRAKEKLRNII